MIQDQDPEEVRRALDRVLARSEFRPEDELPFELGLPGWLSDAAASDASFLVTASLLAVLAAWVVGRLLRAARRRAAAGPGSAAPALLRAGAAELRVAAGEARAAGDLRGALSLFLRALLVGLSERGELRYHPAWTNRELLRRGRPSPAARGLLEPLIATLEPKEFGRVPVTPADLERLEELCARAPGALEAGLGAEAVGS